MKVAQHETYNYLVIPPTRLNSQDHLPSLTQIFKFDEMARSISRRNPTQRLIFSAGSDLISRVHTSFLLGCHLMMSHDVDFDIVYPAFHRMHDILESLRSDDTGSSVFSGMRAIFQARKNCWIEFKETFEIGRTINPNLIAKDEYLHYARCFSKKLLALKTFQNLMQTNSSSVANGSVFTIVPRKILMFLSPSANVPVSQLWSDKSGAREYGVSFYAELLAYLGVGLVVRLEEQHKGDEIFELNGTQVCTLEDLGCRGARDRFSLQTLTRFVDVCRHAPGPVAVCGDDRLACTLLTAYLLRDGHFADAAEAVSWIRIARGAAAAPDYALLQARTSGGGALGRKAQSLMCM